MSASGAPRWGLRGDPVTSENSVGAVKPRDGKSAAGRRAARDSKRGLRRSAHIAARSIHCRVPGGSARRGSAPQTARGLHKATFRRLLRQRARILTELERLPQRRTWRVLRKRLRNQLRNRLLRIERRRLRGPCRGQAVVAHRGGRGVGRHRTEELDPLDSPSAHRVRAVAVAPSTAPLPPSDLIRLISELRG